MMIIDVLSAIDAAEIRSVADADFFDDAATLPPL